MDMLNRIRIDQFPEEALPGVWRWMDAFRSSVSDDFSPQTQDEFVEYHKTMIENGLIVPYGAWKDEELGGYVMFMPDPLHDWRGFAHCVFKKSHWGWNFTVPALQLISLDIFVHNITMIEMRVFENNHPMRSLLRHLGAQEDGRIRRATKKQGEYTTEIIFGLTPDDLEEGFRNASTSNRSRNRRGGVASRGIVEQTEVVTEPKRDDDVQPDTGSGSSHAAIDADVSTAIGGRNEGGGDDPIVVLE